TPHVVDGKVNTILPMGGRVYVGGTFTKVRNAGSTAEILRPGLFAFDAATGLVDPNFVPPAWTGIDPTPSVSKGVEALAPAPDGNSLFVGGGFSHMSVNAYVTKLVKLDAATGAEVSGFAVRVQSEVKDIVADARNDRLFLAGIFNRVNGSDRIGLAAVDIDSGSTKSDVNLRFTDPRPDSVPPPPPPAVRVPDKPRVESIALAPDGKTLVAGGNFTKVDGQERFQIALLDVTPGRSAALLAWQTKRFDDRRTGQDAIENPDDPFRCAEAFDTHIRDLDISPDGRYFVVVTTGGFSRGTMCDTASRWEIADRGSNLQPTWVDYDGGDSFTAVAVTGAAVYVGGHMRAMNNNYTNGSSIDAIPGPGHVAREGIAALDPISGLPLPWDPGRERGEGAWALVSTPEGLWVGSDTDRIGREQHQKLAFFPLAGGAPAPVHPTQKLHADLYKLGSDGMSRRVFSGATMGAVTPLPSSIDWNQARGAFFVSGKLYTGHSDGKLQRWSFDGSRLGGPEVVSLRGMEVDLKKYFPITTVTGMFYDNGRLYFTLQGDKRLFYRYFLSESTVANDVVGAEILIASGDTDSRDWSKVTGMTVADDGGTKKIYWSEGGAELYKMDLANGKPSGSKAVAIANAGVAGRGLFLMPATSAPPPVSIDPPAPPAPPAPPPAPPAPA
ncbi:MAG: hypothetical protein M3357_02140, partial [Actinomycetota bacterium]|nr:hypothetical protein [Actinomycetota bacterium]